MQVEIYNLDGGRITLEYEETPVNEEFSEYRISVQDTGIGMDEEFQKHDL